MTSRYHRRVHVYRWIVALSLLAACKGDEPPAGEAQAGGSQEAQADLVELLQTFTGAPVPAALLVDTSRRP